MHIYMHTFHYFMFSWDYCKFYVIFQWNRFSRPLGVGEGVNGVRGPHPHETRSKQRWQPNATSVDWYYWLSFTCCNHLSLFEKHVSEDDGMFTSELKAFFRLCIYICIKWSKGKVRRVLTTFCNKVQNFHKVPSLNPLTALPFFSQIYANTLCIYICTVQKRLSARYAYIYAHFSLFYVFMGLLQVLCDISMK